MIVHVYYIACHAANVLTDSECICQILFALCA